MSTMRIVPPSRLCPGCKKAGYTDDMEEVKTVGVAGSNEWWHPDCLGKYVEEHPEAEEAIEYPCRGCGGDGIDDDSTPCPACDGEGVVEG